MTGDWICVKGCRHREDETTTLDGRESGWSAPRRADLGGTLRGGGRGGRLRVDTGLLALLGRDRRRRSGQRVVTATGLREGDDVADRVGVREERDDAVPAEGDAAVRRGAEGEGIEEEAELLLRLVVGDPHHREDALLHVALVDTDRA